MSQSCCSPSCENPNSSEYLKCYKPENNSGCCGGCPIVDDTGTGTSRTVTHKWTREDFITSLYWSELTPTLWSGMTTSKWSTLRV